MAMVVQHNLTAMNSNRMLGVTTSAQAKSSEKLSSGYRINRAADDAAGLTISEKMRKQMRGLDRASANAQDGVSAVQTAEGALTEVHSMLQRMNELAIQASNGTNSEADRDAIQAEIDQLSTEIDRVAETTKFNEMYLLKGDTEAGTKLEILPAHDAGLKGSLVDNGDGTSAFKLSSTLADGEEVTIAGVTYKIDSTATRDASAISTSELADKLATAAAAGAGGTADVTLAGETTATTYTYQSAATLDEAALKSKIGDAFDNAKAGDTIVADGKTYKYMDQEIDQSGLTSGRLSAAIANTSIGTTYAAGDTIVLKNNTGTTSYTYDGTDWKNDDGVSADLNLSANNSAVAGDEVTMTVGGTATTFKLTASHDSAAGFYEDGDNTAASATGETKANLQALVDVANGKESATINGTTFSNGQEIPGGWFAADGSELKPSKLAGAAVDITPNGGTAESVTVASNKAADLITKEDAIAKMKEALQQASSIGVDDPTAVEVEYDATAGEFTITQGTVEVATALAFNLHVGSDADMTNKIGVKIETMNSAYLGVKGLDVVGKNAAGEKINDGGIAATYAVDAIADAVSKVSKQRSALGAIQNRLEHTIANLDNVVENTTAAESRIRDTDMAEEMVEYSKNNILAQAGQSMLAQANQATQGVLSLLQ